MDMGREKIGKEEFALLEEINIGDALFGFFTSGGSTHIMRRQARRAAYQRIKAQRARIIEHRLKRMEAKNLIKFVSGSQGEQQPKLTSKGLLQVDRESLLTHYAGYQHSSTYVWDGVWRIVMFDIPQESKQYRRDIRLILQACGFVQVQKSVYTAPYPCKELSEFLKRNRSLGSYVHIIRGQYVGDDKKLKAQFGL